MHHGCFAKGVLQPMLFKGIMPPSRFVPKGIFHSNDSLCQTATVENASYDASIYP